MDMRALRKGQLFALRRLLDEVLRGRKLDTDQTRLWILSQYLEENFASMAQVKRGHWRIVRDAAYPNWPDDDWTMDLTFRNRIASLANRYEEEVNSQMRLL